MSSRMIPPASPVHCHVRAMAALVFAALLAAQGCTARKMEVVWAETPSQAAASLRESTGSMEGGTTLLLLSDDPFLGGSRQEWLEVSEHEGSALTVLPGQGRFTKIIWVLPFSIQEWKNENAGEFLAARDVPHEGLALHEHGFSFRTSGTEILMTDAAALKKWPREKGPVSALVSASFFARAYMGLEMKALPAPEVTPPSAVVSALRRQRAAACVLLSHFRAAEPALALTGEAALLSLERALTLDWEEYAKETDEAHRAMVEILSLQPLSEDGERETRRQDILMARLVLSLQEKEPAKAAREGKALAALAPRYAALRERCGEHFFHYEAPALAAVFYEAWDGKAPAKEAAPPPAAAPPGAPHVILITIDTLRPDALGAYNPLARTPALDALARQSALFLSAFAPIAQTAPSHAAMLTGRYPAALRMDDNGLPLPAEQPALAQFLRRQGYRTAAFVSGFPLADTVSGLARGFEVYDDEMTEPLNPEAPELVERRARETTDRALAWMQKMDFTKAPFFLWVHYYDPHFPYRPPFAFDLVRTPLPKETLKYFAELDGGEAEQAALLRSRYYGEAACVDHEAGRLLEALRERGALERALVVVAADHGESLDEHGFRFDHGNHVYPSDTHVPFFIRFPDGRFAGRKVQEDVSPGSIAPAVAEALGMALPWPADYPPLQPLLENSKAKGAPPQFLYTGDVPHRRPDALPQFAALDWPWFYVENAITGKEELFDLRHDPSALGPEAENPKQEQALKDALKKWKSEMMAHQGAARPPLSEEDRNRLRSLGYLK